MLKYPPNSQLQPAYKNALDRLRSDCLLRLPRDLETFCFHNYIDLGKLHHNKVQAPASQPIEYLLLDLKNKFLALKTAVFKLGIQQDQFKSMIEEKALFEWSTDVALGIAQKFCSWIVPEDRDEDNCDTVIEGANKSASIL